MTVTILGGALLQYFFGWLSDRLGRNSVLLLLGLLGTVTSSAVAMAADALQLMAAAFCFGAATMPMYSMALAAAADNSLRHEFVEVGTSVLLLNAVGAVFAPLLMGQLIASFGPAWLFWGCAGCCSFASLCFFLLLWRKPKVDDVVPFTAAAPDMAPTRFDLDPRAPEDAEGNLEGAPEPASLQDADDEALDAALDPEAGAGPGLESEDDYGSDLEPESESEPRER
jgi:MFS family permease